MQAMVLSKIGTALEWTELPYRIPGPGEIRVKMGVIAPGRSAGHRPSDAPLRCQFRHDPCAVLAKREGIQG
jgi:hypothetical protein